MEQSSFAAALYQTPIWIVGLLLLAVMAIAAGAGLWVRRVHERDTPEDSKDEVGYVVSAVLGLLALLMGFTFSLAVDRYDTRRILVLDEANAIGTAYLRAQLLPEPHRSRTSDILVRYTENRVKLAKAPSEQLLAINDTLTTDLWSATQAAFDSIKGLDFSSSYIDSINTVIDLSTSRKAARLARVPAEVFAVLLIYMIVSAGVMGYVLRGRRGRRTAVFLMALMILSLMLIIDINRPFGGGVAESQAPMEWQLQQFRTTPASTYDRWTTAAPSGTGPAAK